MSYGLHFGNVNVHPQARLDQWMRSVTRGLMPVGWHGLLGKFFCLDRPRIFGEFDNKAVLRCIQIIVLNPGLGKNLANTCQ